MDLVFREERFSFLKEKRYDLIYQEQTAEAVLPETMPNISKILDTFGTVLVQAKTVENGCVRVTGGIQAGVLYLPEGEGQPERIEVWVPFTVTKKVTAEENTTLFYWGWLRNMETRFINSRKIMVKASLGSELTLLTPTEEILSQLDREPEGLECKRSTYPMCLPLAAAEKELQIADELLMPEQSPGIEKLLKATCSVEIDESRCVGDKAVFKGNIAVRVLFLTEDGGLAAWDGEMPFSQYAELSREVEDGVVSIQPILRHLEIDSDGQPDSHRLLLNLTTLAQITVRGIVPLTLVEDAYCLTGELKPQWQTLELEPCLDILERDLTQTIQLPEDAAEVLDDTCLPDRNADAGSGSLSGTIRVNVLYYDRTQKLQSRLLTQTFHDASAGEIPTGSICVLKKDGPCRQTGRSIQAPVRAELICVEPMRWRNFCGGEIQACERKEGPSLVIKTVNGDLWSLAREHCTTVRAICAANHLESEHLNGARQLLIPSGGAAENTGEGME